jgi:hypothetical protein
MAKALHVTHFFHSIDLCLNLDIGDREDIPTDWQMGLDEACGYLDQVGAFTFATESSQESALGNPVRLSVIGADPFFRADDLETLLASARRNRMVVQIWTTGAWVENAASVGAMLQRFAGKIDALQIYTTRALLDRIGLDNIDLLITEARRAEVGVSLRCAIGPDAPLAREILGLETFNADTGFLQVVPLSRLTEGTTPPDPATSFLLEEPPLGRRCADLYAFFIVPGGDVYPCARGVGVPALRLGSLQHESVATLLHTACADHDLGKLRLEGPYHLYRAVKASDAAHRLYAGYLDGCHFHRHVLLDAELAAVVERSTTGREDLVGTPSRFPLRLSPEAAR